jgi:hypothetical protein
MVKPNIFEHKSSESAHSNFPAICFWKDVDLRETSRETSRIPQLKNRKKRTIFIKNVENKRLETYGVFFYMTRF